MDDRSREVLAVAVVFFILSWVSVALRIYVRAFMLKSFGHDDWIMLLTLVNAVASQACCALSLMQEKSVFTRFIWLVRSEEQCMVQASISTTYHKKTKL
jgi:hypothetical protein